jgi:signal peptidase I
MEENKEINNENTIESTATVKEKKEVNKLKEAIEWIVCIIIAIILAILFRYYIGVPTVVKNVSMNPTLVEGQRLILNRWSRTTGKLPERGDIVTVEEPDEKYLYIKAEDANFENPVAVYHSPDSGWSGFVYNVLEFGKVSFVKRVIGLPGDHIEIKNDKVYINGTEYDEPYLNSTVKTTASQGVFTDIVVPENSVFVMGDNRGDSTDSRHFGCIPLDKIESKVLVRFWPLNLAGKVQ